MNKALIRLALAGVLATGLAACSTCPAESPYPDTPYVERTAGVGTMHYGGPCQRTERQSQVRSADPVFRAGVRK